jgi:mono/diheme cytochrome c family protein
MVQENGHHRTGATKGNARTMKAIAIAGIAATIAALGGAAGAAIRPADDVSIRMKVSDGATAGPLASLTVKNLGTSPQNGVAIRIHAENETGPELWAGTVDVPAGRSVKLAQRIWLDVDTTTLVATATLAGKADQDPTDNAARAGLGLRGKAALVLVGRSLHVARCASCHGADGAGGSGPSVVGATSKAVLLKAAAGGDHDFPWLSKADAKDLGFFLKDPAGVVMPPPLPTPPEGGWPTYAGSVQALLDDRCVRCHGPGLASAGIRLDTYDGAARNARRALYSVKVGRMPQGGGRLDAAEIGLIEDWITGGRRP